MDLFKGVKKLFKGSKKTVIIWLIEYFTVYLLPFFIFGVVFHFTQIEGAPEKDTIKSLTSLPNWMLIGIILFGESLKELIEYVWNERGSFKENVKISISLGLFGVSMCAVLLSILLIDVYDKGNNLELTEGFYYLQVSLFIGASIYSFLMRLLIGQAKRSKPQEENSDKNKEKNDLKSSNEKNDPKNMNEENQTVSPAQSSKLKSANITPPENVNLHDSGSKEDISPSDSEESI